MLVVEVHPQLSIVRSAVLPAAYRPRTGCSPLVQLLPRVRIQVFQVLTVPRLLGTVGVLVTNLKAYIQVFLMTSITDILPSQMILDF